MAIQTITKATAPPQPAAHTAAGGKSWPAVPVLQRQETIQQKIQEPIQRVPVVYPQTPFTPLQRKANNTGLPDNLKTGIEALGGYDMSDVKVHYNSAKPATLQAHAYAQGTDIHIGPGQERHLPHEAWHVVQQKQGRVQATKQMRQGVPVNDDKGLESEADVMGAKAVQMMTASVADLKKARQGLPTSGDPNLPVQRYTTSVDGQYHISENNEFAVSAQAYPNTLYSRAGAVPIPLPGGLAWNQQGAQAINGTTYNGYVADITAYDAAINGPNITHNVVGSEEHCGKFARCLANNNLVIAGADRSTGVAGTVLKDGKTSPGMDSGWENHFATVVKRDGGDHATFETAVGIPHTWVGLYGVNKGQTFKYKTQVANIERLAAMGKKKWWQYILCCFPRGSAGLQGITEEVAAGYQQELIAWRDAGTLPQSPYMMQIVAKLEAELVETGGH